LEAGVAVGPLCAHSHPILAPSRRPLQWQWLEQRPKIRLQSHPIAESLLVLELAWAPILPPAGVVGSWGVAGAFPHPPVWRGGKEEEEKETPSGGLTEESRYGRPPCRPGRAEGRSRVRQLTTTSHPRKNTSQQSNFPASLRNLRSLQRFSPEPLRCGDLALSQLPVGHSPGEDGRRRGDIAQCRDTLVPPELPSSQPELGGVLPILPLLQRKLRACPRVERSCP